MRVSASACAERVCVCVCACVRVVCLSALWHGRFASSGPPTLLEHSVHRPWFLSFRLAHCPVASLCCCFVGEAALRAGLVLQKQPMGKLVEQVKKCARACT
eukprot:542266-Alexandrium_andersonii.AAC.1